MAYTFTSEAVSCGHPDKVCDQISDAILDLYLKADPFAHTAVETLATTNRVILAGEVLSKAEISSSEIENTVRKTVADIGYEQEEFDWKTLKIENFLHRQSADIAEGIKDFGAGDQGIMFGYAKNEEGFDTQYMPMAAFLANKLLQELRLKQISGLQPDAKSQVTLEYDDNNIPVRVRKVVLSTQHCRSLSVEDVRNIVRPVIIETIPAELEPQKAELIINPAGNFVIGGPDGDTGLTGRKIVVDTYGGYAPHGGGAFSGKDPSKVDRSAAYMLRWLAKNIVAQGVAKQCLLQISYAIGKAEPLSLYVNCFGSSRLSERKISEIIRNNVDLTPKGIIERLGLRKPIYLPTAAYGHFGRKSEINGCFSWEKLDLAKDLFL
ncbi:MAG: methionine adenosyltransferase [Alphaproteobacteria bacterium]|nr:methionine adenosyltransferase [Alphaproteobacteria bacterium]